MKCDLFPWWHHWKRRWTILASFRKLCPGIKTLPKKDDRIILGSPLDPKSQADLLEKKFYVMEKVNGIVEKLDAHYGFLCWKTASVCQSCCTSWEPVHVSIIQLSWKSVTKPCATDFPKCVMWTSTIFRVLSWLFPLKWVFLGFHPHHYKHFPPFWPRLLVRVPFSRRFSRTHSKMFRLLCCAYVPLW